MTTPLSNRGPSMPFKLPADGWVHLASIGEHPHDNGEEAVVQVVDSAAVDRMVREFQAEGRPRLLDFDHESRDASKSTVAAGWVEEVQARANGLWGRVRWSDQGQLAVGNGRFRFISPVWTVTKLGGDRVRPVRLLDAALTNQPNLSGMLPISNRGLGPQTTNTTMKTVAALLGLNDAAAEEQISSAVRNLQEETKANRAALEQMTRERDNLKSAHQELLQAQVEADLDKHAGVIANRDTMRAALLRDRKGTLDILTGLKPAAAAGAPLTNRGAAASPAQASANGETNEVKLNRAIQAKRAAGLTFEAAYAQVRSEQPALFATE